MCAAAEAAFHCNFRNGNSFSFKHCFCPFKPYFNEIFDGGDTCFLFEFPIEAGA